MRSLDQIHKGYDSREDVVERLFLEGCHIFNIIFSALTPTAPGSATPLLPVRHIINDMTLTHLSVFNKMTYGVCATLRHHNMHPSPALEEELAGLQLLHAKLLGQAASVGMDAFLCDNELKSKCAEYISSWGSDGLNVLEKRILLSEQFGDVQSLVTIATEDLAGQREEQEARNDEWAARFKHVGYATALLDRIR